MNSNVSLTTGQRIRARRKEVGMSAETLASILGVSPATIYRYENGEIEKIPGNILGPLSDALTTTAAYLMGWSDRSGRDGVVTYSSEDNRLHLIISIYHSLNEQEKQAMFESIQNGPSVCEPAAPSLRNDEKTFLSYYNRLDDVDKGRILGRLEAMLEDEKYQQEGQSGNAAG